VSGSSVQARSSSVVPPPFDANIMSGACREAHLPTQHPTACPQARFPCPDAHPRGSVHHQGSPAERPQPVVGLKIARVSERRAFERLTREGLHGRSESLWCRYVADAQVVPPRLAFSIGRSVGTAVARNRLRRRLRAAVQCMAGAPLLPYGWLLIGARPMALERSFDELVAEIAGMLTTVVSTSAAVDRRGA
jgi:ribonuclease P protein component